MRTISLTAMQGMFAQATDEVFLTFVTIDHTSFGSPYRLVNNTADVTRLGNVYTAFPFMLDLPTDKDDEPPRAQLVLDNVTRILIDDVRSVHYDVTVEFVVALASSPDTAEYGPTTFDVTDAQYDASELRLDLGLKDLIREPFPYMTFNPAEYPGLFK